MEFMISVLSLCQVTKELSMGVPSGGAISLPWAVNVTCHMPTIESFSSSAILKSGPGLNSARCPVLAGLRAFGVLDDQGRSIPLYGRVN
jgi:hypothetical protein